MLVVVIMTGMLFLMIMIVMNEYNLLLCRGFIDYEKAF